MSAPHPSPPVPDGPDVSARDFGVQIGPLLPLAYRIALRRSGNHDLAEDLVQEAALNAFVHYDQFKPGTNFRGWFIRILLNCVRSHHRRAWGRRRALAMHAPQRRHRSAAVVECGLWSEPPDLADGVLSRLNAEQVADAIARLPEVYRTVCTLYLVDDLPYAEIAHILGCPLGTVRSRLHRGRQLLQDRLCCMAQEFSIAPQAPVGRVPPEGRSSDQRSRPSAALIAEPPVSAARAAEIVWHSLEPPGGAREATLTALSATGITPPRSRKCGHGLSFTRPPRCGIHEA